MKIHKATDYLRYFVFLCIASSASLQAQQDPSYTQYMYNTTAINPAYAGTAGNLQANLLYRTQWVGVEGAPETQSFGIHSPLNNEAMGIGLNISNDKIGPSNEFQIDGNFSYTLKTGYYSRLAFGLKAGARVLNIDWSKGEFYDPDDVLLNTNISNKLLPLVGAGAYYYSEHWYLGLSVPNFIRSEYFDDIEEAVISDRLYYMVMGGYIFDISENLKFKPAFLTRIVSGAPLSVDVSANFLLHEVVTLGASYRWDDSVSALAGFQVLDNFFLGYSFDYTVSDFRKYNEGTHEFFLRYDLFNNQNKIKSPRFF